MSTDMSDTPKKEELESKQEKIELAGSSSDGGPLESESSDPDIDSSDPICT